ncbi:MAG: hypothetical protein M3304_03300, partial [Actinomycetota bacterium]|nr:hypothetical protein [Actinomycetota bacterium]
VRSTRAWFAVTFVVVAAGCGTGERASEGSCTAVLVWRGVTYAGTGTRVDYASDAIRAEALGSSGLLGKAHERGCEDIRGQSVPVAALAGVSPRLAIVAPAREGIYLAPPATRTPANELPPRLRVLTAGKPCRDGRIRVRGRWIGEADPHDGYAWVQIIAEEGRAAASRYEGFIMDFKVDDRTSGVDSRREWRRLHFFDDRVSVVANCVLGRAANETFLAARITSLEEQ